MKSLTIRQRIQVSFLAILVLMSCVAVMNYRWFLFTEQEAERVSTDTLPALSASLRMRVVWARVDRLVQDLAESRSAEERDRLAEALATSRARLTRLLADYEATVDSELDRINYQALVQVLEPFFPTVEAILAKSEMSGAVPGRPVPDTAEAVRVTLLPLLEKVESILENMAETAQRDADDSARDIVSVVRSAELALIVGGILALLLSILCGYLLNRSITVPLDKLVKAVGAMREGDFSERVELSRKDEIGLLADGFNAMADELTSLIGQVQRSSIQVNTSITEIAATSKEQQATAGEIAATTAEVSDTAKDIAATSGDLVRNMAEVSSVAEQTAALAGGGQAGVERMERTMRDVMEAAGAINAKLTILSEKAGSINQVVTTITKVADQTNLLSLNAAIEAEKAGQYGRGFSVVATEIRRLADQTAASTQDIEQMVRDIQSAVAAGVMGMDKFSEEVRRGMVETQQVSSRLSQIIEQVQGLVPRFEAANEGMQAQAAGASQISDALVQLGEAAQQTVESLHQSAVAIDDLNQVSNGLRNSILRFKLRA